MISVSASTTTSFAVAFAHIAAKVFAFVAIALSVYARRKRQGIENGVLTTARRQNDLLD